MRTIVTLLFALLAALPARAILPESGWYWNPSQTGRGFNIEIQDNLLFVAAFAYDFSGQPTWYVAGGPMSSDRTFSARVSRVTGGPCFGCPYTPPTVSDAGSVSIAFADEGNASITFLGEFISVRRQDFANLSVTPDALYGEWSTTEGDPSFPVYFGDRISFGFPFTTGGFTYAAGQRTGDGSARAALGRYDAGLGAWIMLLDSSSSYYRAYRFRFAGLNRIEGVYWVYLKTDSPSGSGTYFLAHRSKSKARVNGANAPGATKALSASLGIRLDEIAASQAAMATGGGTGEPPPVQLLRELESELVRLGAKSP